jgi:transcriptional regulator with XRE-family HTH domain
MNIREIRRTVGLSQIQLSCRTGIERTRLSFAECGYVRLTEAEEAAIKRVIAETVENVAEKVRLVLMGNGEHAANRKEKAAFGKSPRLLSDRTCR